MSGIRKKTTELLDDLRKKHAKCKIVKARHKWWLALDAMCKIQEYVIEAEEEEKGGKNNEN